MVKTKVTSSISEAPIMIDGVEKRVSYDPTTGELFFIDADPKDKKGSPVPAPGGGPGGKGTDEPPTDKPSVKPLGDKASIATIKLMIERLLRANRTGVEYSHNHTKGKLDMRVRSLVRGMTGSKNIYKRKAKPSLGYNFLFLVDTSGSMYEKDKMGLANKTLANLLPALDVKGVSSAVVGFTETIQWVKGWEQPSSELRQLRADGGNWDYIALHYALNQGFADAPQADRRTNVLIMLSDGEPCTSGGRIQVRADKGYTDYKCNIPDNTDRSTIIAEMVKRESERRGIKTYGVGIMEGGQQITRHTVVKSLSALQPTMEKIIREIL